MPPNSDRAKLAARLRELRKATGVSGSQFARQLGWVQPKVSRLERGNQLPTDADIAAWVKASGADQATLEELRRLRVAAHATYQTFRHVGGARRQAVARAREANATRIAEFQPALIPGLLQTAAYAHELLSLPCGPLSRGHTAEEIDRAVAVRMERQQVLYDSSTHVQIVVLEAALHARLCSVETLHGQLDRLLAVADLPALDLRIIPTDAPIPVWPIASFIIYDHDLVVTETLTGSHRITEPQEVTDYDTYFELLRDAAASDQAALTVIHHALETLGR